MKYIVDFDIENNESQERATAPAGVDKARYIIEGIISAGEKAEIISPAGTRKKSGYVSAKKFECNRDISVKLFATFGVKNKILKGIRYYALLFKLFLYLLFNIKNGEKIIVYHTMKAAKLICFLKRIKKFYLILQTEEIYSNAGQYENSCVKYEYKVIDIADAYIFPTKLLNDKVNTKNKPYVIVHGTYRLEEKIAEKFDDGKIHCVYAGTFDKVKGGAQTAINVARYLDEKYHIHILGFGTEREKEEIIKLVDEVSKESNCKISFDGLKKGEEYKKFLQSCHIGLSTQNPEKEFNNTSFPSKILSYMANGLCVVSVKIPVLETSDVNESIFYYEKSTPAEIAKAIKNVCGNNDRTNEKILKLDKNFRENISRLFEVI